MSLESVSSVTYANFECDMGYTLKGFEQLACRTTGSWDYMEPSCGTCFSVSIQENIYKQT